MKEKQMRTIYKKFKEFLYLNEDAKAFFVLLPIFAIVAFIIHGKINWQVAVFLAMIPSLPSFAGHYFAYGMVKGGFKAAIDTTLRVLQSLRETKSDEFSSETLRSLKEQLGDTSKGNTRTNTKKQGKPNKDGHKVYYITTIEDMVNHLTPDQINRFSRGIIAMKNLKETHIKGGLKKGQIAKMKLPVTWIDDGSDEMTVHVNTPVSDTTFKTDGKGNIVS